MEQVRKILVVDDDQTSREAMRKVFERDGYFVETVPDCNRALERLLVTSFDLVVCDYRMPGKNGLDLLRELQRLDLHIPVLIVSGFALAERKTRNDIIVKYHAAAGWVPTRCDTFKRPPRKSR